MFSFVYDSDAHILRISVEGLYAPEDVHALQAALVSAARRAAAICDHFDVLVESFHFPLQDEGVADMLAGIMHAGMALTTGYAAIVVGSLANKDQVERTLIHPNLKAFMTMEEARGWLARRAAARSLSALTR